MTQHWLSNPLCWDYANLSARESQLWRPLLGLDSNSSYLWLVSYWAMLCRNLQILIFWQDVGTWISKDLVTSSECQCFNKNRSQESSLATYDFIFGESLVLLHQNMTSKSSFSDQRLLQCSVFLEKNSWVLKFMFILQGAVVCDGNFSRSCDDIIRYCLLTY